LRIKSIRAAKITLYFKNCYGKSVKSHHPTMKKTLIFIFLAGPMTFVASAQMDSSPLKGKLGAATRYAGGVDKDKIMDLFQDQQFDEAVSYLSPVLKADSDNIPVLTYAGYAYYMQDNEAAAVACYRRLIAVDSNSITGLHYLVLLLQNSSSSESAGSSEALGYASRLLALQPSKAVWWRTMGELFRRVQRPDSALAYLERAYALAPSDLKTITDLGGLLIEGHAYDKADSLVDVGLGIDSLNVSLLKLRVQGAYWSKHYEAALVPGERLLRLQEPAVNALEWLSLSYYDLKQYSECIRVCEGMQELGLDIEAVYYYESRAQAKLKNYVMSDSLLRKALRKAISNTAEWYYDDLGDNYESTHDYRRAVAHYDTAYYLFKDPLTLYTCGRICETELHDVARAGSYFRRYLALAKPQSAEEKKVYGFVRKRWGRK
jgi:tetratricopeptide (TPR) repeat protein